MNTASMPTGRWLYEQKIVTNLPTDKRLEKCIQQVGIDLTIKDVHTCTGIPEVSFDDKILPTLSPHPIEIDNGKEYWHLMPGFYDITFNQGCKIPNDLVLLIRQRSTLLRSGVLLHSSVFDPGYECDFMGTVLHVRNPQGIVIFKGARVAQIYGHKCDVVAEDDLYGSEAKGSSYQNETRP